MKSALWLIVGIGVGLLAAHQVNRTAPGRAFLAGANDRVQDFTDAVKDGYAAREAELRTAVDEAHDIVAGLSGKD